MPRNVICKKCGNHIASKKHKEACKQVSEPILDLNPPGDQAKTPKRLDPKLTGEPSFKLFISPMFRGEDKGDGGVRRVVEMEHETFPKYGVEIVKEPEQADIIIVHIREHPNWLQRFSDRPIVADCHGLYWAEYEWLNWAYKANEEVMETIRQADAVVAHSEWVAQAIRRHTMRPVEVVYLSIDPAQWESKEDRGYVLWNKTRPDPICDPFPLIQLASMMTEIPFVTTFDFTDQGVDVPENVQVTGVLPFEEAKGYVERAGVYLCTARETFGIGTLEAMAAGVPVVGWDWGGQREISEIVGGEAGGIALVTPGNFSGLAEKTRSALSNRQEMGKMAQSSVREHFDHDKHAPFYVGFLQGVLDRYKEERPRTSIVVTAYNLEQYLDECLASVLDQVDEDWECVVVDDASPDRCGDIAEEWGKKDSRFKVVHNKTNQYLAGARNTGIKEAKGRYILPLDADDMLHPDAVQRLADALDADRSVHIAYGNVRFVDEDGETPTDYSVEGQEVGHSGWPIDFKYEWQVELQRNLLPYCSMFRKNVWKDTGGYRKRCRTAEDADFWSRAASYGFRPKLVTKSDTLIYRNRQGSMSREEGGREWAAWLPWKEDPGLRPAGSLSEEQSPIHSCDPPIISVIIPVGSGHEELMWDAIDSVDAQTFRQWECIVVNDTGKPFPRSLPSWVKELETWNTGGKGVAHARNLAISQSRGRFFVPLDADDYMQPSCLQQLFAVWMETGEDHIIYSDWYDEMEDRSWKLYETPDYDAHLLIQKGAIHAVTALYTKALWKELGGFDESLPAWEDWDFLLGAAAKGRCSRRLAAPLWVYRKHTGYRREDNFSEFETSKQGIIDKWGDYFERGKQLMACSGCSGRKTARQAPVRSNGSNEPPKDTALIEYVGGREGKRQLRGPSGQTYTFGGGADRQKYVRGSDIEFFLSNRDFRPVGESEEGADGVPEIVAEGPPAR